MNKFDAQAFAAVICRAVDYWHCRQSAERIGQTPETVAALTQSEAYLAEAMQAIADDPVEE